MSATTVHPLKGALILHIEFSLLSRRSTNQPVKTVESLFMRCCGETFS